MVQVNSISATCKTAFGIPLWATGAILAVFSALILIGGMKRLMHVTDKIAPFMAVFFLLGGLAVLVMRIQYLPATFGCIFKYAFSPEALLGGGFGYAFKTALSQGIKRGLFSNEAGMGSTPHLHAIADVPSPHVQGTVAMIGLFIDTFVILTMTALVVISTVFTGDGPLAHASGSTYKAMLASSGLTPTNLMQYAISSVSSSTIGNAFVAVCLFFFAFSSVIVWIMFGKINCTYLKGKRLASVYMVVAVGLIFCGTLMKNDMVWELQDLLNQLMVLPNVAALIALSGTVALAARRK
jgi:AGCS family alanine or glycine:cation symporter